MAETGKQSFLFRLFALLALVLLAISYFAPVWWVSLKAPQYPEQAFPDGIRIHFHMDSVVNGCRKVEKKEIYEEEALDCKHEMDAINHYVGMYPIAAGGPVERAFSPFVFSLFGLMLIAFCVKGRKPRTIVLAAGSILIAAWMSAALHTEGGVKLFSPAYVSDMQGTMDLEPEDYESWTGKEAMTESYQEALGRYFRNTEEIATRTGIVMTATQVLFWLLLIAMAVLVIGNWRWRAFYWLLVLVPALLPVLFLIDYAAWLWWFGHNLNAMGAFTVKPFMPTVFGVGKVAQFSTYSYPSWGYGLLVLATVFLLLSFLIRRKQVMSG